MFANNTLMKDTISFHSKISPISICLLASSLNIGSKISMSKMAKTKAATHKMADSPKN